MGRHSIKFKITLMLTIIISSLLVLLMILNSTMSEKFYLNGRRKQMLEGYTYINNTIVSYTGGTLIVSVMKLTCLYRTAKIFREYATESSR